MIDPKQLKDLAERTLKEYDGLYSETALNLVLGTIAVESRGGTYIRQLNGGPARGIAQIERPTFEWLKDIYMRRYGLANYSFEQLEWDLKASILFCRLRYFAVPEPLPNSLEEMAEYWKRHYNTILGAGSKDEFIVNYREYVGGI